MVTRVVIGNHPTKGMGLYVSQPGYDALVENPDDKTKFSFSSSWGSNVSFLMSGTVVAGTWVSLPTSIQYYPFVHWDLQNASNIYYTTALGEYSYNSGTIYIYGTRYGVVYRINSGVYQFKIENPFGDTGTCKYIVTNLKIGV